MNPENWKPPDFVISEDDAAKTLCLSKSTLRRMVANGEGPKRLKLSARRVGYRNSDLIDFLSRSGASQ